SASLEAEREQGGAHGAIRHQDGTGGNEGLEGRTSVGHAPHLLCRRRSPVCGEVARSRTERPPREAARQRMLRTAALAALVPRPQGRRSNRRVGHATRAASFREGIQAERRRRISATIAGTTSATSPITAYSAFVTIGASGSVLMAITCLEAIIPTQ